MIITVTKIESKAVLNAFEQTTGKKAKPITIDDRVYRDVGEINDSKIFMALSEMGAGGLGAAQQAVQKGITALNPHAVIMIGIAFGVDEQKQVIGDILISRQLMLYDTQRIEKDGRINPRNDRPHASSRLINYLQSAHLDWDEATSVEFGLILSGEKLVDNLDYRESLKGLATEAIGGEMEGAGLYTACHDKKVDWILVKAICDWADGNKHQDKEERQKLAAKNAATFVLHALQHAPLERPQNFKSSDALYNLKVSYAGNATESGITESSSSTEFEQLRSELGSFYAKNLDSILSMRSSGQIEVAWEKLISELASLNGSQIPQDIQARYYYHAARWAQEDDKPVEQYSRYYNTAHRLNPQLDDRTYRAFEAMAKEQFEDAIAILSPLDSEPVALSLLRCLLHSNQFLKVDEFMAKLATPRTDEIQRLHALCRLAARNANGAWQAFEPVLSKNQHNTLFQLTAGYIAFWQAVPTEFHKEGVLPPQFFIPNLFSLDDTHEHQMRIALHYLEQALHNLNTEPRNDVRQAVINTYLAVCICLPDKHVDAIAKAKTVLIEDPIDSSAVCCLLRLAANHEWSQTLDVLDQECKEPNPPIWQIEMLVELLLYAGQFESAWQCLSRFEYRFLAENEKLRWFGCAIYSLGSLNRLSELENKITELDDCAEYLCIKASYWLGCNEDSKALIIAQKLANNSGTRFDYINLVNLYYQKCMWQELTESASYCLEHFKADAPARIAYVLVQAWMELDKPKDALAILEQYQSLFESDGLLNDYYGACMIVQNALGHYLQAWEASEKLWQTQPNESLLVQRAYLQVMLGDVACAVEILKKGINQGFKSPQVLMQIAHYALPNDQEAAFQYAKEAVECFPDDSQLLQAAMMIGFHSGHSDWAGMQLAILHQKFPDSGLVREIKLPTLLEWGQEHQERSREYWQQFLAGQLPLHLLLDSRRTSLGLGAEFYWRWHHNHNKPLCEHVPFPIAYAGRTVEPFDDWKNNILSMDYSACLIAHQLTLFPRLADSFETIYIPPSLFRLIQSEIHRLAEVQTDRVEQAENLLKQLKELPITLLPAPHLEAGDFNGLQPQDRIEWVLAEQENLLIVTEQFATEIFESGSIPPALEKLRVSYADVFTALEDRGELSLDYSPVKQTLRYAADLAKVEQLTDGTKLLVDSPFLEQLIRLNILEATSRIFQLCCVDNIHNLLSEEIESYQYRQKIKKSLESLQTELKRLLSKGKLKLLTLHANSTERDNELHHIPLTNELLELFSSVGMNCPVWIDDRLLSSYPHFSPQEPIVGIYDVLAVLHSRGKIAEGEFLECFRHLIRVGVGCRLPPISYLITELEKATFDSNSGLLIENSSLAKLRENVFLALVPSSILNKKPLRPELMPEEAEFRFQLHRLVDATMVIIWTSDKFDQQRRFALSDWLYNQFLPQRGRYVSFGEDFSIDPIQRLAMEQSFRISLPWQFINQSRNISEYYHWLFSHIIPTWQHHPSLREAALSRFAELIIEQINSFLKQETDKRIIDFIFNPLRFLPSDAFNYLLAYPALESHLKSYFLTGEYLESLDLFIPEPEWQQLTEDCINLGIGKTLSKVVKGRTITLEFKPNNGVGDMIAVSGQTANAHLAITHILNPYMRLEHSSSSKRIEWLNDIAQAELLAEDDSSQYRTLLASDDFRAAAKSLQNCCEHSDDFFFAFACLALEISDLLNRDQTLILPAYTNILISASPSEISAEWLFADISNLDKTKKHLASVAALPFGEPFNLATLIEQAILAKWISTEKITELLNNLATSSLNPVVLQNLLTVYLRLPQVSNQKQTETLIQTLLTLKPNSEINEAFEHYIELLHLIWNYFQLTAEFKNSTYEQRVTWAYIYADRMLSNMLQQKVSDSDYWGIASKNIKEAIAALQEQQNPFVSVADNEADVILPSAASWWRTIIGGTLGILKQHVDSLSYVQQTVIETLQPVLNTCNTCDHSKFRHFEFLEPTDFINNHRNSPISNQGWTLAEQLRAQLSGEELPMQNYPMVFWLEVIKNGDCNSLTNYFAILARNPDPVPSELVELLTSFIETFIQENELNQDNQKLFFAQAHLLGRLKNEQALNLRERLIDKAINALHREPDLWLLIPDLVFGLYRFDDPIQRTDHFIITMNRVASILVLDTKEFSKFYSFIRRVEAYIPSENWQKLWEIV